MARQKDYFSFESIRDKEGNVICYHVTMIGTIEYDGVARLRTDFGANEDQKMAFGRLTICGLDKKIKVFTNELNCRIYYHSYSEEILSYEKKVEDPANTFRLISYGKDVLEEVFKD